MFESWNTSSRSLVDRLRSDSRSELCRHGAEIYPVNMNKGREVRAGWIRGSGKSNICMARIVAKANGSIDLYLHLDPNADLIGDGKPFASACVNCHRILHRPPFLTVEQLRNLLDERQFGSSA